MAVAPTGAIYKALEFDSVSSRTYGVYITGEAVYNAPERDLEMITIPGRNGSFALDNGRFQNIEVSYPAGIFAETEADFRAAISDFRNFLCSRNGYVRLKDEYNPNEYRMAVYKSGLEVTPAMLKAGEFTITFDCKPQRWLTSGETKQTIASSGDTITNPTLFDARPLLEVTGYGDVTVNGSVVHLADAFYGDIELLARVNTTAQADQSSWSVVSEFNADMLNIGDELTLSSDRYTPYINSSLYGDALYALNSAYSFGTPTKTETNIVVSYINKYTDKMRFSLALNEATFHVGTPSTITGSLVVQVPIKSGGTVVETAQFTQSITLVYDGDNQITSTLVRSIDTDTLGLLSPDISRISRVEVIGHSTVTYLGNPTYIDCDLGACYAVDNGTVIDLNRYIDLGSQMPSLSSGANTITFDNTVTKLEIVPRWWKV